MFLKRENDRLYLPTDYSFESVQGKQVAMPLPEVEIQPDT